MLLRTRSTPLFEIQRRCCGTRVMRNAVRAHIFVSGYSTLSREVYLRPVRTLGDKMPSIDSTLAKSDIPQRRFKSTGIVLPIIPILSTWKPMPLMFTVRASNIGCRILVCGDNRLANSVPFEDVKCDYDEVPTKGARYGFVVNGDLVAIEYIEVVRWRYPLMEVH